MTTKLVAEADIPQWQALSAEYDQYVKESVADISEWYNGSGGSQSFMSYMRAKILQQEAFMAIDCNNNCLGIIAFSKKHSRITFFAVSYGSDFFTVANALFRCAFDFIGSPDAIYINEIISSSEWIGFHRKLYHELGFVFLNNAEENGVPIRTLMLKPPNA